MVEGKAVEHLAHVEADVAAGFAQDPSNLPEHRLDIDVDLDIRSKFTIDICQIAIRAIIGQPFETGTNL